MDLVQRISLRRVSATLAFADVRLPSVHLLGLRVEQRDGGSLVVTPPEREGSDGRRWPHYALQPGAREAVEAAIGQIWAASA